MGMRYPAFAKKLRELLEENGWTQEYLAEKIGFTQQAVGNYLAGSRFPRKDKLELLAAAFGKSAAYFYDDVNEKEPSSPTPPPSMVKVPIVSGKIAGGSGQVANDLVEDWAWIPVSQLHGKSSKHLACVKVTGDSMEPMIKEGAMVCIDRSDIPHSKRKVQADAIYAVRKDGDLISVKHIDFTDHIMVLMSENRLHHPTIVDLRDNPSPVIGRVVWVWQAV